MKIVPIADLKARLSTFVEHARNTPVVITKNGRPVAVLAGIRDEANLSRMLEEIQLANKPAPIVVNVQDELEAVVARIKAMGPGEVSMPAARFSELQLRESAMSVDESAAWHRQFDTVLKREREAGRTHDENEEHNLARVLHSVPKTSRKTIGK